MLVVNSMDIFGYFVFVCGVLCGMYGALQAMTLSGHIKPEYRMLRHFVLILLLSNKYFDELGNIARRHVLIFMPIGAVLVVVSSMLLCLFCST